MTGLYVHIPFCKKKCHYCNFVVALAGTDTSHGVYLNALEKEAAHYAARFKDTVFDTVYLGGGTPSTLRTGEFESLFHILKNHFRWKKDAEITCEANPGDIPDLDGAFFLKGLGISRISLGAQSFHDETLKRLNRDHGAAATESAFRYLRDAGFKNISLDLILSLPGEPWSAARESLERAVRLFPEHISLYELTIEEKTVFGRMHREGRLDLPTEEEQFDTLSNARLFLREAGYRHYELLSYAKPGFESRHNLIYWANEEYLGLGPGATSYFDGRRFKNSDSYDQYREKVLREDWTAREEETLEGDQKELESFLLALRLTDGADEGRFPSVLESRRDELTSLCERGLLSREDGRVRLSAQGQFFAETVFTELSA